MAKKSGGSKSSGKKSSKASGARCTYPWDKGRESRSVETKKISNGYVTTETVSRNGVYKTTETFTPGKPSINVSVSSGKDK